ncbi:MAG: CoA transferase subunit A [Deltaproteobacteria bacterium]|nr:CoA transferase subunit A [Deltaproteobacteria bacterium]
MGKRAADKICSMSEAIAESVHDGDEVVIEGFTHLICFAAGHEIIRQRKKDLIASRLTPDLVYDQLVEAGAVKKMVFSWAGNPGVGSLHAMRRKTEAGSRARIEIDEYSHFGMLGRFLAGAAGLPFWTLNNYGGTDIPSSNPNIKWIECPYTGQKLAVVPALRPDVAIIQVQRADRQGNAQVWGLMGTQKESAFASKRVVIVAEELVDTSLIRMDPNRTLIPGICVDHVVHEPWAAHPSYAQGYYDRDNEFYVKWDRISRDPTTYADYLNEFVYGVKNRAEYVQKLGNRVLEKLKAKARICEGVNYGF